MSTTNKRGAGRPSLASRGLEKRKARRVWATDTEWAALLEEARAEGFKDQTSYIRWLIFEEDRQQPMSLYPQVMVHDGEVWNEKKIDELYKKKIEEGQENEG